MQLGDWSIRHWKLLAGVTTCAIVIAGGLIGSWSTYNNPTFPALGGPNALLYDATLKILQAQRRRIPVAPAVFVALDDASLADPELAALPRPLLQPIWGRLIDGLLDAGSRMIAFDVVFAYAGADFQIGSYTLPDYDQPLIAALSRARNRIVLGRFPTAVPAAPFVRAAGASRVGMLDLQLESDGRVRSTAALVRLPDGRIGLGFAALAAGLGVRQAAARERILITPYAPLHEIPTYSLAGLLACLRSAEGAREVRQFVEGRVVVIGTAVLGEDEHRGPTRFMGRPAPSGSSNGCAPGTQHYDRPYPENGPGAFLQIAAIQAASSDRPITLAPAWLRISASAWLVLAFAVLAFQDRGALTLGERNVARFSTIFMQSLRSATIGLLAPAAIGVMVTALAFAFADVWLPMGYPIAATTMAFGIILGLRSARHRAFFRRLYRTAGRYLPAERLVKLARGGFADPGEGEEREVSILLADLVGFTAFSNRPDLSASEVVRTANHYFCVMQVAIDHHEGCSDKFLGDALLAFWNGLSDEPDHALKAVAAARELIIAVNEAKHSVAHALTARAVVCSGRVYVGDLGAKQRSSFTIIGPAVNEIFRLEKAPDLYGVPLLLAASTAASMQSAPPGSGSAKLLTSNALVRLDDLELKGFSKPESIYALVPLEDPCLAKFQGARSALDEKRLHEALSALREVNSGMLQAAAQTLLQRYGTLDKSLITAAPTAVQEISASA
ncbi:MAG: CHASE2 domain-containing protein [Xanthobacteraceae bacterium]